MNNLQFTSCSGLSILEQEVVTALFRIPDAPLIVLVFKLETAFGLYKVSFADVHVPSHGSRLQHDVSTDYVVLYMWTQCRRYLDRAFESTARYL